MILTLVLFLTIISPIMSTSSSEGYQSDADSQGNNVFNDYVSTKYGVHKIHNSRSSWNEARNICLDEHAQLVIIDSAAEEAMLKKRMKANNINNIWIGVHDMFEKKQWTTVKGEKLYSLDYVHWRYGEPNGQGEEHCVELIFGGMNDRACEGELSFVCEK